MTSSSIFFDTFVSVKFGYWFSLVTGSGVMTISFYKGFAQYLETGASKGYEIWHERLQ